MILIKPEEWRVTWKNSDLIRRRKSQVACPKTLEVTMHQKRQLSYIFNHMMWMTLKEVKMKQQMLLNSTAAKEPILIRSASRPRPNWKQKTIALATRRKKVVSYSTSHQRATNSFNYLTSRVLLLCRWKKSLLKVSFKTKSWATSPAKMASKSSTFRCSTAKVRPLMSSWRKMLRRKRLKSCDGRYTDRS